jgi:hypothetical protein
MSFRQSAASLRHNFVWPLRGRIFEQLLIVKKLEGDLLIGFPV